MEDENEKPILKSGTYLINSTLASGRTRHIKNVDIMIIDVIDNSNKDEWEVWTRDRKGEKLYIVNPSKLKTTNRFLRVNFDTMMKDDYIYILDKKFGQGTEIYERLSDKGISGMGIVMGVPKSLGLEYEDEIMEDDWVITTIFIKWKSLGITYDVDGNIAIEKVLEKYADNIVLLLKSQNPNLSRDNLKIAQISKYGFQLELF